MKHQNLVLLKKTLREIPVPDRISNQPRSILADSPEIMEIYYTDRLTALTTMLNQLTLLNNAKEITFLCKEISTAKKILRSILVKKNIK